MSRQEDNAIHKHINAKTKNQHPAASPDDFDYLANAASATEFTGLIPSLPQNEAELASYNDICRFLPPVKPDPSVGKRDSNGGRTIP